MIRDAGSVLKFFRLYQHHLQLRCGIYIDDLIILAGRRGLFGRLGFAGAVLRLHGKAPKRIVFHLLGLLVFLKIVLEIFFADPHKVLEFIDETHNGLLAQNI